MFFTSKSLIHHLSLTQYSPFNYLFVAIFRLVSPITISLPVRMSAINHLRSKTVVNFSFIICCPDSENVTWEFTLRGQGVKMVLAQEALLDTANILYSTQFYYIYYECIFYNNESNGLYRCNSPEHIILVFSKMPEHFFINSHTVLDGMKQT